MWFVILLAVANIIGSFITGNFLWKSGNMWPFVFCIANGASWIIACVFAGMHVRDLANIWPRF